ncbi:2OG-Fe dioxygenase family protein [Polynucleobacter sp. AP-Kolm-20A-A1]|uniref:2OG-Fe dioxygenase family protein n=1 Tax=Polynucleobacter sp. AP-Kolm-20A-A1 TaxID=2081041 RepID=UPI001BFED90C|nr:2OG-Fe dioxygenase family protein [Polynucleobacter sp. AP-Kolm-20A-A1]QWE20254.1 2OG-Fe dioxygenase family protein [Polynucleobacter sp. AP-Kolm-20A-A1]
MTNATLAPPLTSAKELANSLRSNGYVVASAETVAEVSKTSLAGLQNLTQFWEGLPRDPYLKDGGRYRFRRHASYEIKGDHLHLVPHRAHWQSLNYNALHGGIERWFEPVQADLLKDPAWQSVLLGLATLFNGLKPVTTWFVEVHQFRIDTTDGIGRPTPEGAHRDGVDFVAVFLLDRSGIKGGETRIFDAGGSAGLRFTLSQPWSALIMNDERMIHESTPIQPIGNYGYRDTLVLTYRSSGFQDSPQHSQQ